MLVRLKESISNRVKRCRALMGKRGLAGLIVADPPDVRYLTGFGADDSVLVLTARRKVLVTDSRFVEQARRECPQLPLKVRRARLSEAVGEVLAGGSGRGRAGREGPIGIEDESVTVKQYRAYRQAIGKKLKTTKPLVKLLRVCKDNYEVSQIRRAVRVAEGAMRAMLCELKVGMTEIEFAGRLEYEMLRRGGAGASFATVAAFGGHAAQPHAVPGRARLAQGQSLLFDWGAMVGGYRSDLTRCFVVGRIRPAYADAYRQVLEAQLSGIQAVRPGVAFTEVDRAARAVLGERPGRYGHGTGHGIGLSVHEKPTLSSTSKGVLEEGMVITIEPGLYMPGQFGIRIEDDVLVTARGSKVLSTLPKDLDSVML